MSKELNCLQGKASITKGPYGANLLTGRAKKAERLSWSLVGFDMIQFPGKFAVALQRLYSGNYGDAYVEASELFRALTETGCGKDADELAAACLANNIKLA